MTAQPSSISSNDLAPVRTTFPEKNIKATTLRLGYLKMSPGKMWD
jgi:hypothetical protein